VPGESEGELFLKARQRMFQLCWLPTTAWHLSIEDCRVSPSYGVAVPATKLLWRRSASAGTSLQITVSPTASEKNNR